MSIHVLGRKLAFPSPSTADEDGLLAIGGDLAPERLLLGYAQGIFPWPSPDMPLLWFSPDPRCVLPLDRVHIPSSLARTLRRGTYDIKFDTAFTDVIHACSRAPREGQHGTWITPDMELGYTKLHELGYAHSIEAWKDGELVGGLYGVSLGHAFFGESMFAEAPDASKAAFTVLVAHLRAWKFSLLDCQMKTPHLARFGAEEIPRSAFLAQLRSAVAQPTRLGPWAVEMTAAAVLASL